MKYANGNLRRLLQNAASRIVMQMGNVTQTVRGLLTILAHVVDTIMHKWRIFHKFIIMPTLVLAKKKNHVKQEL